MVTTGQTAQCTARSGASRHAGAWAVPVFHGLSGGIFLQSVLEGGAVAYLERQDAPQGILLHCDPAASKFVADADHATPQGPIKEAFQ